MRLSLLILTMASFVACQGPEPADYVFWNGTIRTMVTDNSIVEAVAVRGDMIIYAGPKEGAQKLVGDRTLVIDLMGKTLLPGFTDAHVHPVSGGLALKGCDLTGIEHPDSVLAAIAAYAENHPENEWVRADNFWLPVFPNGNPKKEWLDKIVPDRPVYVTSADGHNAWVNSKALELAGITAETPDPAYGRIERVALTKEPSGTLREEAMDLVSKLLPKRTKEELAEALLEALKMANSLGITNLVEASASEDFIQTYVEVAEQNQLTAHVSVSIYCDVSKGMEEASRVINLFKKYAGKGGEDLRFDQVKIFMDGVVEGKTAAMLDNYAGESHNGFANATPETANQVFAALDKADLQIHVHAIGDRGVRMALDAFEYAKNVNGIRDSRHHIAHLHVIHPDDIPRFKALDVTANFQTLWATLEDSYMTDMNFPFLGKERIEWQYPVGSVAHAGGRLAFGSDWDVSTMDPFDAMQVAVTRRGPDSTEREPWTPQHLTDVATVVRGYTKIGAFLTFHENECGTIEVGKLADLVVLDRDIFTWPKLEIYQTQVMLTMFRGQVVYTE